MRKRISPATGISIVALFFSITGAGMAATGYRITSLWQIAPKVRAELRGATGATGATGSQGAPGMMGPQGPQGQPGQPGLLDWNDLYYITGEVEQVSPGTQATASVQCANPPDHLLVGGPIGTGAIFITADRAVTSLSPGEPSQPGSWAVTAAAGASSGSIQAWAECVKTR